MNNNKNYKIFCRLRDHNPYPKTELIYQNPFELLIAVMLSAQSKDIIVNKVTEKLFAVANTPNSIIHLGLEILRTYIKSIGLFNIKANNIIKTCLQIINLHDGKVPEDLLALEALPGVGRKTANVVLNIAFSWPTIAVDTHVFRVSNRTGIATGKNVSAVEQKLLTIVPSEFKLGCHQWLILHGRYTCSARAPRCISCIINDLCEFNAKNNLHI